MTDELLPLPWGRTRRGPGPARVPLTRERIVDAAYVVLDREGHDRLSVRQVAAELGVAIFALYAHVSGKDELLKLMHARLFAGWSLPEPDPERRQEQIMEYARAGRARLHRHRDMDRLSMGEIPFTPELFPHPDRLLGFFRAAGLPGHLAGTAGDPLSTFIEGFSLEKGIWNGRHPKEGEPPAKAPFATGPAAGTG